VKLLFDQNLAPRLVRDLADLFPSSAHVMDLGLESAPDQEIWNRARDDGFVIVSKDNDFQQMSFLFGPPPKVIWIRRGNCSVKESAEILRTNASRIEDFVSDAVAAYLVLF
jgi:predicted nuclease of predicted toxin-antitoxin system